MGAATGSPLILLVEDNSADVHLVKAALSEHHVNHSLTVIKDGESAIQYIDAIDRGESRCPDLVVLDLNLPRKTGREVLERMRLSPRCSAVPIVILSSSGAEKDREDARALGATLYLKKPSDLGQFLAIGGTIKQLLETSPRV
jgi:CheY-like chemotaxis protein